MQQDTCILALDCATGPCSTAIWAGGRIVAYLEDLTSGLQSARLLPMVEQTLSDAGLTYQNLSAVACTVGPGSFTGIRIGLAAARGIAFAAGIPGMGFTTLEAIAFSQRQNHSSLFTVINAGKGEWYYQAFINSPHWHALGDPALAAPAAAAKTAPPGARWVGNVEYTGENIIKSFPRADALAELAAHSKSSLPLVPFYIRPPDITMPKTKK